jgi:hypothetical protein
MNKKVNVGLFRGEMQEGERGREWRRLNNMKVHDICVWRWYNEAHWNFTNTQESGVGKRKRG